MDTVTFLLIVVLKTSPNVIIGVDGEYKTAKECAKEKILSIKANPKFAKSIKCMKVLMIDAAIGEGEVEDSGKGPV